MESLLYFVIWAAAIYFMMRYGCGAHVMGHGGGSGKERSPGPSSGNVRWVPPETDTDPVCGKNVRTDHAKPSLFNGMVYYFCSRECRERFEAAPETYLQAELPREPVGTRDRAHG